jgi:small subunit ribosomal protein S1
MSESRFSSQLKVNKSRFMIPEIESEFSSTEDFGSLLNDDTIKSNVQEGTVVKGIIVATGEKYIIDIGRKMEGEVPAKEFRTPEDENLGVGDEVEVYLEKIENRSAKMVLSREKVLREKMWEVLDDAMKKNQTVDGTIVGKVKGGFTVDICGVIAFLPGSQVDIRPIRDISPLMNILQPFQVLKIDRKQGNIVVSRRAILEESRFEARSEFLDGIDEGVKLKGTVKNITDYGAFIDLGSVDGLLHVTDISWSRINHPSEVLSIGQEVEVMVIKYNKETKRISLGMKQLEDNPWKGIEEEFPKGKKFRGKITNITDYGAFIELKPGIEGLVHVSEISWTKNNVHPRKLVNIGDEVDFMVLEIDPDKHRISLGMKQFNQNPWQEFADKYPVGSKVVGEVKNVVDFGLFVGFENGVDGLVHVSDLTWQDNALEELKKFEPNSKVDVKVLSLDVEKERISLGIKQLAEDPFERKNNEVKKGDIVTSTVINVRDDGIEVEIATGLTCFIKKSDLSSDRIEQRPERFAVGDRVDAKVTSIDKVNRKFTLSIKAMEVEEQKKAIAEYGSTDSGASIGDILGVALTKATREMEEKAAKKSSEGSN